MQQATDFMRFTLAQLARLLAFGVLSLFIIAFIWLPSSTAVNAPNADDFDILLAALIRFDDADLILDKVATIFMRHGEHYVVFARLVAIAQAQVFGEINFATLIIFGALAPIFAVLVLIKISNLPLCQGTLAACIAILLPQYVESLAWASGGLQHLWLWSFALAALACAQSGGLFLAIIFAITACLTQGNGIVILPLCAVIFGTKKRWLSFATFLALSVAAAFLHTGSATDAATLIAGDTPILSYIRYSLGMLGSPLARSFEYAIAAGGVLCVVSLFLLSQRKSWRVPAVCCLAIAVIFTAALNALARIRFGESYGFDQSRYTYPGLLLIASLIILGFQQISSIQTRLRLGTALTLTIAAWWIFQSRTYSLQFALRTNIMTQSLIRSAISDQGFEYPNQTRALDLIQTAQARSYYQPPTVALAQYISVVHSESDEVANLAPKMATKVEHNLLGPNYLLLSGYGFDRARKLAPTKVHLILRNSQRSLDVSASLWNRPDVLVAHRSAPLECGFIALIARSQIENQDWDVSLRLDYADRSVERQIAKLKLSASS